MAALSRDYGIYVDIYTYNPTRVSTINKYTLGSCDKVNNLQWCKQVAPPLSILFSSTQSEEWKKQCRLSDVYLTVPCENDGENSVIGMPILRRRMWPVSMHVIGLRVMKWRNSLWCGSVGDGGFKHLTTGNSESKEAGQLGLFTGLPNF